MWTWNVPQIIQQTIHKVKKNSHLQYKRRAEKKKLWSSGRRVILQENVKVGIYDWRATLSICDDIRISRVHHLLH